MFVEKYLVCPEIFFGICPENFVEGFVDMSGEIFLGMFGKKFP